MSDPECQYAAIKEECKESACPQQLKEYNDCVARIATKGHGNCEPYFFDLLKCADKCAIPKISKMLK